MASNTPVQRREEKPKHTPGPWFIKSLCAGNHQIVDSEGGDYFRIAQRVGLTNARLISAVPDYYAATEEIRRHLVHSEIAGDRNPENIPYPLLKALLDAHVKADHELSVMRDVLAKAEGEVRS